MLFQSLLSNKRNRRGANRPLRPLEQLEERTLMCGGATDAVAASFVSGFGRDRRGGGRAGSASQAAVVFSQLSDAVKTGLTSLATTDGVTAPTAASKVYLANLNGVETYSVVASSTGKTAVLTVDAGGIAVKAPTHTTTTLGTLANDAVTQEVTAIAAALNLATPTSATTLYVTTTYKGVATYSVALASATATGRHPRQTVISVDASGNPTGNEAVPLSTLSQLIQDGLTSNVPTGATAPAATTLVTVRTLDGATTYSLTYHATGVRTTVSVDATGQLADQPSTTSTTFSAIPAAANAELASLATAAGATTAIADDQSVTAYDEGNGTTIYSVRVAVTKTAANGNTFTCNVTLTVDQSGNPTVAPGGFFGGFGFGGFGGSFGGRAGGICV